MNHRHVKTKKEINDYREFIEGERGVDTTDDDLSQHQDSDHSSVDQEKEPTESGLRRKSQGLRIKDWFRENGIIAIIFGTLLALIIGGIWHYFNNFKDYEHKTDGNEKAIDNLATDQKNQWDVIDLQGDDLLRLKIETEKDIEYLRRP